MKNIFYLATLSLLSSCSTSYDSSINKNLNTENSKNILVEDTYFKNFKQLRLLNIKSALDSQKLMYLEFGIWDESRKGFHQENINQKVWKNIDIFNDGKTFTIIADGSETSEEYYSSLIIYDNENKDCLDINYPQQEKLISFFQNKMKLIKDKNFDYNILRKNKKKK